MRIHNLTLKNIGPFREANLDFDKINENDSPVTIITGENGTGKTIILDAIRGLLLGKYAGLQIKRNIIQNKNDFFAKINLSLPNQNSFLLGSETLSENKYFITNNIPINSDFVKNTNRRITNWIVNYWTSQTANDSFELKSFTNPIYEDYLVGALDGVQKNVEVTQLICAWDYLKSSDSPKEKAEGEFLFNILKKIIKLSLIDGQFEYVERRTFTPIVSQTGYQVSLDKLSSGNLYLIQRLVSLLGQMYAVHVLNNGKIEDICKTSGLLLIDEAENHLHPKWQKTFLSSILEIFPNLQIIVTTHSPFIVSSVKNARVYVCKSMKDYSIVVEETDEYINKPVEEILLSAAFDTNNFGEEITELLNARIQAITDNNDAKKTEIESELLRRNPEYFSYFRVDELLKSITK